MKAIPKNKNIQEKVVETQLPPVVDNSHLLLTQEDLRSLNIVFGYAKLYTIDNDENLLELLIVKRDLFTKLKRLVQ